jgi:hypothetical protein
LKRKAIDSDRADGLKKTKFLQNRFFLDARSQLNRVHFFFIQKPHTGVKVGVPG